jgi:ribosomal protein L12E/L44/L45/RPP1/RPP2
LVLVACNGANAAAALGRHPTAGADGEPTADERPSSDAVDHVDEEEKEESERKEGEIKRLKALR